MLEIRSLGLIIIVNGLFILSIYDTWKYLTLFESDSLNLRIFVSAMNRIEIL